MMTGVNERFGRELMEAEMGLYKAGITTAAELQEFIALGKGNTTFAPAGMDRPTYPLAGFAATL